MLDAPEGAVFRTAIGDHQSAALAWSTRSAAQIDGPGTHPLPGISKGHSTRVDGLQSWIDSPGSAGARSTPVEGVRSWIELRRHGSVAWRTDLPGVAGPLAQTPSAIVAAVTVQHTWQLPAGNRQPIRGEPGSVLVGLDRSTGAPTWQMLFDATEWALVTSLAVDGSQITVGGIFSGTLRVGDAVVTSGGLSDGFVASLDANGSLKWLRRIGGPGADTVAAVAVRPGMIAIAGTVAAGAEFGGHSVEPRASRSLFGDGFVAAIGPTGNYMWAHTFGGPDDDIIAGVAIDADHRVAVATTIRDTVRIGTRDVSPRGASSGLVVFASANGQLGPIALVEATGWVRLQSIVAVDDNVVVSGLFAGTLAAGATPMTAVGTDDAFVASVTAAGHRDATWHLAGRGRQDIVSLAGFRRGFLAGVAYSDEVVIGSKRLPKPAQPNTGSALVIGSGSR